MEGILKRCIAIILIVEVYVLYLCYNALNESYIVNLNITV